MEAILMSAGERKPLVVMTQLPAVGLSADYDAALYVDRAAIYRADHELTETEILPDISIGV